MNKKIEYFVTNTILLTYFIGIAIDWAYWINVGWKTKDSIDYVLPVIFGWMLGLFWPIHVLTEMWNWILS